MLFIPLAWTCTAKKRTASRTMSMATWAVNWRNGFSHFVLSMMERARNIVPILGPPCIGQTLTKYKKLRIRPPGDLEPGELVLWRGAVECGLVQILKKKELCGRQGSTCQNSCQEVIDSTVWPFTVLITHRGKKNNRPQLKQQRFHFFLFYERMKTQKELMSQRLGSRRKDCVDELRCR